MFSQSQNTSITQANNLSQPKIKVDYAIISAMPEELAYFIEQFADTKSITVNVGEFKFKIYNYLNKNVLLTHTGMGTVFAASILTLIHSSFNPEFFLIAGTAGGIDKKLSLRDVIIVEKAFEAEIQDAFVLLKNTPFENCLVHPIKNQNFPSQYPADPELLEISNLIKFTDMNVTKGTVVSSNAFPAPIELFNKIKTYNPLSIDMETSAFYQTAWLLNTKVLAVRGISNLLNNDGTDEKVHASDVVGSSLAASKVLLSILNKSIELSNKKSTNKISCDAASKLTERLKLIAHPEGGSFASFYKSKDLIQPITNRYNNESRSASTSIYYLLKENEYSSWHSLKSDEIWHFYKGVGLIIYIIDSAGHLSENILGDPTKVENANFQVCVPAGCFFAAKNLDENKFTLVGCTVSPGFEYQDFELADINNLKKIYPQHSEILHQYAPQKDISKVKLAS